MSETVLRDSLEKLKDEIDVLFENETESKSSSDEPPMAAWSSLRVIDQLLSSSRKPLQEQGLHSPGSGELCAKYIQQSDSAMLRHPHYHYPAVLDPGIKESLLEPEPPRPLYSNDGYQLYMDLCEEWNICPVRLFYSNLTNPEINLRYYCVTSANIRIMAMALQNNEHVKCLDLTDNYLDLDACYHLGQMLKTNKTLEELILDGCRIQEAGLRRLGAKMNANLNLKTLSLAKNDLDDNGGELFASIIDSGANFSQVNLSYNKLGTKATNALKEALIFKNIITHLDISWNPLVNVGSTVTFLKTLADTGDELQELNLSFMGFESMRVADAIAAVTLLPKLTILNLNNNRFSDNCAEILVSNLASSNLRTYNLSNNLFTPVGACSILQMLTERRVKLQNLYLDNTCVNINFMAILEKIRNMKSRKKFVVTFDKVLHDWVAIGDDPRMLILRRGDYMGKMQKKAPKDVPMFLLSLCNTADRIRTRELIVMMKSQKIPVNDDWVDGLIQAFPGPLIAKKPTLDTKKLKEYIRRIWPNLKLPPNWKLPVMSKVDLKKKKSI